MSLPPDLARAVREALSYDLRTPEGNRGLLAYVMDLLDVAEFRIVEQAASLGGSDHTNLIGLAGPHDGGGLLLSSAVLKAQGSPPELWTETEDDPLNATETDGLLFGLGASGNRLDLICRIVAMTQLPLHRLKRPLAIVGLCGDDARVGGAMHLLDSGLVAPAMALVSDATSLEVAHAHRGFVQLSLIIDVPVAPTAELAVGSVIWTVTVLGVPAHTASPGLGRNALSMAVAHASRLIELGARVFDFDALGAVERVPDRCRFVVVLPKGEYPALPGALVEWGGSPTRDVTPALIAFTSAIPRIRSSLRWASPTRDDDFLPLGASGVFTSAETKSADALLATRLTIGLELRPRPGEAVETLLRDLEGVVRRSAAEWHGHGTLVVERQLLPFDGRPDSALAHAVRKVSPHPTTIGTHAGFTEAWVYQSVNIDTAVFGPGSLAARSRPNEYAVLKHLDVAYHLYGRLVKEICF